MRDRKHRGVRWASVLVLVAVLMSLVLAPAGAASQSAYSYDGPLENVVADWNLNAADALVNAPAAATVGFGQAPNVTTVYFAMMHGAIYDAIIMINGGYQPYLANLPQAPRTASKAAAVATAAHDVLVSVVSDPRVQAVVTPQPAPTATIVTRLDGLLATTLAAATAADGAASVAAGVAAGKATAAAMIADRANDGRYVPLALVPGTDPGEWRPEPPANASDPNAWLSKVDPFMLTSPSQFRSKGPNALTSEAYTREYNEVKTLGAKTGSTRTPAQDALTVFYDTNAFDMINRAFRTIALDQKLTLVEQARYFAMVHLTAADTLIGCWNEKVYWGFWRPITAIRQGEGDGNPQTIGDPAWEPLLNTPPYSDHISGYNCISGAFASAAAAYFGKNEIPFRLSKAGTTLTRDFTRLSDLVVETIDVRVYHGLHFRTADVAGAALGLSVAGWMAQNYFRPAAPAPPPTGTGGNLPGLPNTGAGGGGDRLPIGWLLLAAGGALALGGGLLGRRVRRT